MKAEPFESTASTGAESWKRCALPADEPAGIPLTELGVREDSPREPAWLRELVDGLQRDGLALVAEDSPSYDADYDNPATSPRVRLP